MLSALLVSLEDEEASAGALGSVGLLVAVLSVPDGFADVDSPVPAALGSSAVVPAGAGSPGFTTPTTLPVPPVVLVPLVDAPPPLPTRLVFAFPPLSTSKPA